MAQGILCRQQLCVMQFEAIVRVVVDEVHMPAGRGDRGRAMRRWRRAPGGMTGHGSICYQQLDRIVGESRLGDCDVETETCSLTCESVYLVTLVLPFFQASPAGGVNSRRRRHQHQHPPRSVCSPSLHDFAILYVADCGMSILSPRKSPSTHNARGEQIQFLGRRILSMSSRIRS